jgi:hypothetical protein
MHPAQHEFRATTDEAIILVAPFHELRVTRRLGFNFFASHEHYSSPILPLCQWQAGPGADPLLDDPSGGERAAGSRTQCA